MVTFLGAVAMSPLGLSVLSRFYRFFSPALVAAMSRLTDCLPLATPTPLVTPAPTSAVALACLVITAVSRVQFHRVCSRAVCLCLSCFFSIISAPFGASTVGR